MQLFDFNSSATHVKNAHERMIERLTCSTWKWNFSVHKLHENCIWLVSFSLSIHLLSLSFPLSVPVRSILCCVLAAFDVRPYILVNASIAFRVHGTHRQDLFHVQCSMFMHRPIDSKTPTTPRVVWFFHYPKDRWKYCVLGAFSVWHLSLTVEHCIADKMEHVNEIIIVVQRTTMFVHI